MLAEYVRKPEVCRLRERECGTHHFFRGTHSVHNVPLTCSDRLAQDTWEEVLVKFRQDPRWDLTRVSHVRAAVISDIDRK